MPQTLTLYIGNKNYSSWSMRPWVLLRQSGIAFRETMLRFDGFGAESSFKKSANALSPFGTVPTLVDGDLVIWDSMAIAEYLAEKFPDHQLWPQARAERARARSVCAQMHSGFGALRKLCPMNIEADLAEVGAIVWRDNAALRNELAQLQALLGELLNQHRGPLLFERFSIADAMYAPIATRVKTYGLPVDARTQEYLQALLELSAVQEWTSGALAEQDFFDFAEPYRFARKTKV